jgi:hypothetical protein
MIAKSVAMFYILFYIRSSAKLTWEFGGLPQKTNWSNNFVDDVSIILKSWISEKFT